MVSCDGSFSGSAAFQIMVRKRSMASARFSCCDRVFSDRITKYPSLVSLFAFCEKSVRSTVFSVCRSRSPNGGYGRPLTMSKSCRRTLSSSHLADSTLNLRSTLVCTLLTFCPPGPPDVLYVMSSASIGMYPSNAFDRSTFSWNRNGGHERTVSVDA